MPPFKAHFKLLVKLYLYSGSCSSDAEYLLTNSHLWVTVYGKPHPFLLQWRAGSMNPNDFQLIRNLCALMSVLV